ncbi:MAG: response regulator transcription factor [Ruminococcus sp.]|nr:response regulator transcription factor [Ruminococcus sp.]
MRIAIVDDESLYLEEIQKRITDVCNQYNLEYKIECYKSPMLIIDEDDFSAFDIVLLDIDMPGMNGIELAKQINRTRRSETLPYIIFVSAMDNLVFDALKQFPYSFVRKTHLEELDKCVLNIYKKLKNSPVYALKIGRTTKLIELSKTIYLEKQGNYVDIITTEEILHERSLIDDKYKDLAQFGFVRPHVGAIVNANYITDINSNYLRLSNGKEMSISRTYKKEIKAKYQEWLVKMK